MCDPPAPLSIHHLLKNYQLILSVGMFTQNPFLNIAMSPKNGNSFNFGCAAGGSEMGEVSIALK